ncbi:MAG: hypothetical protein AAGJ40_16930 [Planctomycetota bacterium]
MSCHELAERLSTLRPDLTPLEIARLCLMLLNSTRDPSVFADDRQLSRAWQTASFRLETATDQHAAVVSELNAMIGDSPIEFSPDQLWALMRALKVQGQMLELYTREAALV